MLKRTIEISSQPAHLSIRHGQITLSRDGKTIGSVPCEDIGTVVVDHPQTTYTHAVLREIVTHSGSLVICGRDHQPTGILIPLGSHSQIAGRTRDQIEATLPIKKRIWQQLIRGKISEASKILDGSAAGKKLDALVSQVRAGDPENVEARAARIFWQSWLPDEVSFRRDQDGDDFNGLLNYGYAIVRALISRTIVSAGYTPAIGIHHHHRANPFCLSDDLIEPLRPIVDACVRELLLAGHCEINRHTKAELLGLLHSTTELGAERGPLNVVVHRYVNRFGACLRGETKSLDYPKRVVPWN